MKEEDYTNLIWYIVRKILKKINDEYYYEGLDEDLFQEGYIALLLAEKEYNPNTKVKFTTFAYKYIYGYCLNYIKKEVICLRNFDIDTSPAITDFSEIDSSIEIDLIKEINKRLSVTNKKLSKMDKEILENRLLKEYSLKECAEISQCSNKKVVNTINKYKDIIKNILLN